jgi:hypothetical protein
MPAQFRWAVEGGGILLRLTVTTKRLLRTDVESQVLADKWVDT